MTHQIRANCADQSFPLTGSQAPFLGGRAWDSLDVGRTTQWRSFSADNFCILPPLRPPCPLPGELLTRSTIRHDQCRWSSASRSAAPPTSLRGWRPRQQYFVENRPGAGSNIGTEYVMNAQPDGYTILADVPTQVLNVSLYQNLRFDFMRDATLISNRTESNL